jgi:hypothetical protein
MRKIDMVGSKYGSLAVVSNSDRTAKNGARYVIVVCDCGAKKEVLAGHLRGGKIVSCGCEKIGSRYDYLIGSIVNGNEVLERDFDTSKTNNSRYYCKCRCGNVRSVSGWVLENGKIKHCSACLHGENHPAWRGGVSEEYSRFKTTKLWREYRDSVFRIHGSLCLRCKSRLNIEVHHIMSYIDNPHLVDDPNNGVPLCRSCHAEFHSVYGKGGNNMSQLQNFTAMAELSLEK